MRKVIYSIVFFLLWQPYVNSQHGDHFVRNFLPAEYSGGANNFGVTQDNDGLIFIANINGVLIFDGVNWELCKRPDEICIQSIARTGAGEIVVGTVDGDIALISKNKAGKFQYISLLNKLSKEEYPREIIRQIITLGENTYFLSSDKLVEYSNGKLKAYSPLASFHNRALVMGNHLFVNDIGNHLSVIINGKLEAVKETESLSRIVYFHNKYSQFYCKKLQFLCHF